MLVVVLVVVVVVVAGSSCPCDSSPAGLESQRQELPPGWWAKRGW